MTSEILNSDNIIDSRDIEQRIEEVGELLLDPDEDILELDAELAMLRKLNEEGRDIFGGEWDDGVTLVRDGYFEDYARELAKDTGSITDDMNWPANCIDWEEASTQLQMDYTSIEFEGETYWGRS